MHIKKRLIIVFAILFGFLEGDIYADELENDWGGIDTHGFISQGFLKSDRNNFYADTEDGTFQFNEFGLNLSTELTDRLHIGLQFLSRDLGDIGNNKVEIDWAYANYHWKDWLGFRAGLIKFPWGIYNETRDVDMLRTSIFLPSSLYAEEERDTYTSIQGIGFYGSFSLKFLGSVNYQFQYGDKHIASDGGLARRLEIWFGGDIHSFEARNIYLSNLEWETPLDGLRFRETTGRLDWEFSGVMPVIQEDVLAFIPVDATGTREFTIFSLDYSWENLIFAAECFKVWEKTDEDDGLEGDVEEDAQEEGYYCSVSYRFTDWFELGAYYSVFYSDADDKEGKDFEKEGLPDYLAWQKDFALTTRFDLNEHWTLKFEGHFVSGAARILPFNLPEIPEEESWLFAIKTTVNF